MKNQIIKMYALGVFCLLQPTLFLWAQQPTTPAPAPHQALPDSVIRIGDKEIIIREAKGGKKDKAKIIIDEKGIVIRSDDGQNVLIIDDNGIYTKNEDNEVIINDEGIRTIDRKKNEEHVIIGSEPSNSEKKREEKKMEEEKVIIRREQKQVGVEGEDNPEIEVEVKIEKPDGKESAPQKIIKKILKIDRPKQLPDIKTRWLMLDLGVNGYMQDGSLNLSGDAAPLELNYNGNIQASLHVFKQRINLLKHHVNLLYGLSFDFHRYNFEQDITLVKNTSPLQILPAGDTEFKRNVLKNSYMTMPLMLNFETNPYHKRKSFRLNIGAYGGIKLGSRTVQINEEGDKLVSKDGYNLSNFRYGLIGMVGVGPINFTLNYSLQPLFAKNKGPEVHPVGIQLAIIPF